MRKYIPAYSPDSILVESAFRLESGETPFRNLKGDSVKLDRVAVSAKRIIGCTLGDIVVCDSNSPNYHKFIENFDGHPLKIVGVTDTESDYKTLVFAGTINRVPVIRLTMDEESGKDGEYLHYDYFLFKGLDKPQMLGRKREDMVMDKEQAVESINASLSSCFASDPNSIRFRVDTIHSASFDPMTDSLTVEVACTYENGKSMNSSLKLKGVHTGKYRIKGFSSAEGNILVEGNSIVFGNVKGIEENMKRCYEFDEGVLEEQMNSVFSEIFAERAKFMPFTVSDIVAAKFSESDDSLLVEAVVSYEDGKEENAEFRLSDIHTGTYTLTETSGVFDMEDIVIEGNCSMKDDTLFFSSLEEEKEK